VAVMVEDGRENSNVNMSGIMSSNKKKALCCKWKWNWGV